jgi:hypothetical protein
MSRFDDEPLSPEERALADRLARLGPHEGPSSSLDAKILAAAHAAVGPPQRRRRWPGLAAVPGSLITGAGMAAALVLVIGTVWQLRPSDPAPRPARSEGDGAYVSAEIIERRRQVVAPPPPPAEAAEPARASRRPVEERGAAVAQRKAAPATDAAAPAPEAAPLAARSRPGTVGPDEQRPTFRETVADSAAADSYAAPAAAPAPPAAVQGYSEAQRREAFEVARARQQASDEPTASGKQAAAEAATAAVAGAPAAASVSDNARQQQTLDRIEVTGSRITEADLLAATPVAEDARLDAAAWLERIRTRRDAGDAERARESLALFRKAHPRVSLPRDLRALARPATTR